MNELPELLVEYRVALLRYVERHAGAVQRFEGPDDLVQGIHLRALQHKHGFEFRGKEPFLAWMYQVARSHIKERREHWMALKRRPAGLFRLTQAMTSDPGAVVEPAGAGTGPSTFAARREQLTLAVKALGMLMPRDRDLVQWASEGASDASIAQRLDLSPAAVAKARQRALERFRKAHRLLSRPR